ncbi:MAG: MOSC domain-containing protein [Gammaproteobacteria bacterium]
MSSSSVSAVFRYPVKGLGGQELAAAQVRPGAGLAFDRRWILAVVDDHSSMYDDAQSWRPWQYCMTLKKYDAIARLRAAVAETSAGLSLAITAADGASQSAPIDDNGEGDFGGINRWLQKLLDDPRINVQHCRRPAWDERDMPVSIVNNETVAEFAGKCGEVADMTAARFRGNIVISQMPPWREHSAQEITIGKTTFRVLSDIPRCAATQVNPQTAQRDAKVPLLLHKHYGHNHLGVYADALAVGDIATGAEVL